MLLLSAQVNKFLPSQMRRPSKIHSIRSCIHDYKGEIINLLNLIIPKVSDGFSLQKGATFGFGPTTEGHWDGIKDL